MMLLEWTRLCRWKALGPLAPIVAGTGIAEDRAPERPSGWTDKRPVGLGGGADPQREGIVLGD